MFTSPTIVDFFDCADISSAVGSVGPSACAGTWVLTLSRRASSPHQIRHVCRQWARSPVFNPFSLLRAAATCAESSVVSKRLHCTGDRMCHKTRVLQGWSRNTGDEVLQERARVCNGSLLSPESCTADANHNRDHTTTTTTTTTTPTTTQHHNHHNRDHHHYNHNTHHNHYHHHNNMHTPTTATSPLLGPLAGCRA